MYKGIVQTLSLPVALGTSPGNIKLWQFLDDGIIHCVVYRDIGMPGKNEIT